MDVQIHWPQKDSDKNPEVLFAFSSKNGKSKYKEGIIDDYFDGYFSEEMIVPGTVMLAVLYFLMLAYAIVVQEYCQILQCS